MVATNQAGIGRGVIDMASINAVHAEMNRKLLAQGGRLDAVFFCPHTPEEQCACRKPLPGMMLDIGRRYGVDLAQVLMVADTVRDIQAAVAAGCEPHLVLSGRASALSEDALQQVLAAATRTQVHADLAAFAEFVLTRDHIADSGAGSLGR